MHELNSMHSCWLIQRIDHIQDNHFQLNGEFPFRGGGGGLEINDKSFLFSETLNFWRDPLLESKESLTRKFHFRCFNQGLHGTAASQINIKISISFKMTYDMKRL